MIIKRLTNNFIFSTLLLSGCASVQPVGSIGPKKLQVYVISHNDFLSANRMMVILDKKGNIAAYTGGSVAGPGTVAMETTGELATAGAIVYGARAVQGGLQNAHVNVKGVPKKVDVNTNINLNSNLK